MIHGMQVTGIRIDFRVSGKAHIRERTEKVVDANGLEFIAEFYRWVAGFDDCEGTASMRDDVRVIAPSKRATGRIFP